jgi:hypothetical protein
MSAFLSGAFHVLVWATIAAVLADVLILLPLAVFRRTRKVAGLGLYGSSWLFGLNLWLASALFTYIYWGWPALIFGLFVMGVGVFPIAVVATLWYSDWHTLGALAQWVALTFGVRFLAVWIMSKSEPTDRRKAVMVNQTTSSGRA